MTYTFKAGETYQTPSGREAHIVVKVRHWLIGYIWSEGSPEPMRWSAMGSCEDTNFDLLPSKRRVWVAVWRDRGCATVQTLACDNERHAERVASKDNRVHIAVLGPIDVEADS